MKRYTLALLITSSVALAGDPGSAKSAKGGKEIVPEAATLWAWFAGASGGYLLDNESGMVHGHLGVDLPRRVAGFDQALFLEVGWTECGDDWEHRGDLKGAAPPSTSKAFATDLQIIPITLNWKLERQLAPRLSFYMGAGAGIAIVDMDVSGAINGSDDDVVFFGQVFAGLLYNLTDDFEVYGGVRGIYMDEPDLSVGGMDLGGNTLDTDVLIEGGGRVNF
jgi:opacity protein-like surface antigen